jgi:6,7-dimethyl-8-ribityllumazine synthase
LIPLAGGLRADGMRFALVVSRFNEFITARLRDGAAGALRRLGAAESDVVVIEVPGALEIPAIAHAAVRSGRHDAVVCLGAVIRGDTTHYDHVSVAAVSGAAQVALEAAETGVVVTVGILTTENLEQAIGRAGGKAGNKGAEAAMAAVELVDLRRRLGGK